MVETAVTPSGVRDGEPAALAGLCDRRGPAVLAYCRELAGEAAATAAAAEAFARFRVAVVAADDPTRVNPEALLLSATRYAAVRHSRGPAAGLCADVPRLLAARADRSISPADRERLEAHLVMCNPCRAPVERFRAAERAYRDPPRGSITREQSAVIVAALAAAAPVRSFLPLPASVEGPAVVAAAPQDAAGRPEPQPVDSRPAVDDKSPVLERRPMRDAEPAVEQQPPAAEPEPVTHAEQTADAQPADDAAPAGEDQPAAVGQDPVSGAQQTVDEQPAGVASEPARHAEPGRDDHASALEPTHPDHADVAFDDEPPIPGPVPAGDAGPEHATGDQPAAAEPAAAEPAAAEPAVAASTSTVHARDERDTAAAAPLVGTVPPAHAAGGDGAAVELAPLTAAARQSAGHRSPSAPAPEPEPASQSPVVDAPTTQYRVIDDLELEPDASHSGAESTNGAPGAPRVPASLGGFGRQGGSPPAGGARAPAMRRAGAQPRSSGGTRLPRPQRAPAATGARTSGAGMRPSILLPVALVALSLVVALFVAGVFSSDDPRSGAGATVPGAPPATATTTPEIVVVPGARSASAAEVERAKARARAQRRREAKLSGASEEADPKEAPDSVRDEGGAVVDASPAPADAPSPAADRNPPATDRPGDSTGGTGVDADNDSTGGRQVPPSQDASTVPDLSPPAEPVTPP